MTWMDWADKTVQLLQLIATVLGLAIIYFKIARKIGQWEEAQKNTVDRLEKVEKKVDTFIEKIGEKLGTLAERVYELFGQLKK